MKLFKALIVTLFFSFLALGQLQPQFVLAASSCNYKDHGIKIVGQPIRSLVDLENQSLSFTIDTTGVDLSKHPKIIIGTYVGYKWRGFQPELEIDAKLSDFTVNINASQNSDFFSGIHGEGGGTLERHVFFEDDDLNTEWPLVGKCQLGSYIISTGIECKATIDISQTRPTPGDTTDQTCSGNNNGCLVASQPITFKIKGNITDNKEPAPNRVIRIGELVIAGTTTSDSEGKFEKEITVHANFFQAANDWKISVLDQKDWVKCGDATFDISNYCDAKDCKKPSSSDEDGTIPTAEAFELCSQVPDIPGSNGTSAKASCETCFGEGGVWTAIGCISANPEEMIAHFIRLGVGIGGGVALLMTLVGGFLLTTSQGNPKQQDQAKEMVTSATIGLLFVLFSVVLLQFIGVTVLQIPGFGAAPSVTP